MGFCCKHNKVSGQPTAISDCADGSGSYCIHNKVPGHPTAISEYAIESGSYCIHNKVPGQPTAISDYAIGSGSYCIHNKVPGHPTAISDCVDGSGSYHYLCSIIFSRTFKTALGVTESSSIPRFMSLSVRLRSAPISPHIPTHIPFL